MDTIYKESGSHWSQQVSAMAATQCLQCDQTFSLSAKGVSCKIVFGVFFFFFFFFTCNCCIRGHFSPIVKCMCIVKCGVSCSLLGGPW